MDEIPYNVSRWEDPQTNAADLMRNFFGSVKLVTPSGRPLNIQKLSENGSVQISPSLLDVISIIDIKDTSAARVSWINYPEHPGHNIADVRVAVNGVDYHIFPYNVEEGPPQRHRL